MTEQRVVASVVPMVLPESLLSRSSRSLLSSSSTAYLSRASSRVNPDASARRSQPQSHKAPQQSWQQGQSQGWATLTCSAAPRPDGTGSGAGSSPLPAADAADPSRRQQVGLHLLSDLAASTMKGDSQQSHCRRQRDSRTLGSYAPR